MDPRYLAGIVDGEGCIRLMRRPDGRYRPEIIVANTDRRLMNWLERHVGGKAYKTAVRPAHWKPGWNWVLTGHAVLAILEAILPFLVLKHMHARVVLAVPRFRKPSTTREKWTPKETAESVEAAQTLTRLNRRGVILSPQGV